MQLAVYEQVKKFKTRYPFTIAWRIRKHCKIIEQNLAIDEQILYAFTGQHNDVFYNVFSTAVFVITDRRLMIATKRLLFGYFFYSITPDLFNDLTVVSGILFGKIIIDTVKEKVVISNLSKSSLQEVSKIVSELLTKGKEDLPKTKDNQ